MIPLKNKKTISYIVPPLITAGLCYVLYSDTDLHTFTRWLPKCDYLFVGLFILCNAAAMLLRALRWRIQLRAMGLNPSFGVMARAIFGTYAVNLVFPRLGEFWRCAYVSRSQGSSFSGVFGTMVADRLADTATVGLIALTAFGLSSDAMAGFLAQTAIDEKISSLLSSPAVMVLLALCAAALVYILRARNHFAAGVRGFLRRTWRGFSLLFTMPGRGRWLLLTAGIWGSYILSMYCSMRSFPPTASLGAGAVMITFVFGSLAMAVPSNGGIGPWQFAIIMSLSGLYGIERSDALSFATLNLGATTLLTIALGIGTFLSIGRNQRRKVTAAG